MLIYNHRFIDIHTKNIYFSPFFLNVRTALIISKARNNYNNSLAKDIKFYTKFKKLFVTIRN